MGQRTIEGNVAATPERVQAGQATVTKFRVIENTGERRGGEWREHDTPTTHFVEAWFGLGDAVANEVKTGDALVIIGDERSESWGEEGNERYGRVIRARRVARSIIPTPREVRQTQPE